MQETQRRINSTMLVALLSRETRYGLKNPILYLLHEKHEMDICLDHDHGRNNCAKQLYTHSLHRFFNQ